MTNSTSPNVRPSIRHLDPAEVQSLRELIEIGADKPTSELPTSVRDAVHTTIKYLNAGVLRVAEPPHREFSESPTHDQGDNPLPWNLNLWIKKAILLYFRVQGVELIKSGSLEYWDKVPVKSFLAEDQVRVVPPAVARYGAHIEAGVVLMPSYVNIGAWVGAGSMIDTWATVGSCAQIGKNVHLSGGVGIGGVLEPLQAQPVIIEDDAFIGSRAVIVEGVHVGKGAVIGAGTVLTGSTKIVDVTQNEPVFLQGRVPANRVVIPGVLPKKFLAGEYGVPCALIVGMRKPSTDKKTALNQTLREFNVPV